MAMLQLKEQKHYLEALKVNKTLTHLDLDYNRGDEGAIALADGLKDNDSYMPI